MRPRDVEGLRRRKKPRMLPTALRLALFVRVCRALPNIPKNAPDGARRCGRLEGQLSGRAIHATPPRLQSWTFSSGVCSAFSCAFTLVAKVALRRLRAAVGAAGCGGGSGWWGIGEAMAARSSSPASVPPPSFGVGSPRLGGFFVGGTCARVVLGPVAIRPHCGWSEACRVLVRPRSATANTFGLGLCSSSFRRLASLLCSRFYLPYLLFVFVIRHGAACSCRARLAMIRLSVVRPATALKKRRPSGSRSQLRVQRVRAYGIQVCFRITPHEVFRSGRDQCAAAQGKDPQQLRW